jgi:2-iminobutanoate/2-iminopropanoate deaminase
MTHKTISIFSIMFCIVVLHCTTAFSQADKIIQKQIKTSTASAGAPFSQGIEVNGFVFLSGMLGVDATTGTYTGNDVVSQLEQVVKNITEVLKEAGCTINDVVKATVFLTDMKDYAAMNEAYMKLFRTPYPARTCVEVSKLPREGAVIEVEVIAVKP